MGKKYTFTFKTGTVHFKENESENFDPFEVIDTSEYDFTDKSYTVTEGGGVIMYFRQANTCRAKMITPDNCEDLINDIALATSGPIYVIMTNEVFENDVLTSSDTMVYIVYPSGDSVSFDLDEHMNDIIFAMSADSMPDEAYEYLKTVSDDFDDDFDDEYYIEEDEEEVTESDEEDEASAQIEKVVSSEHSDYIRLPEELTPAQFLQNLPQNVRDYIKRNPVDSYSYATGEDFDKILSKLISNLMK